MTLTVRYFAGAAAATGTTQESVSLPDGARVSDLVAMVLERHGPTLARVLAVASILVDEVAATPGTPLPETGIVDVLPPFAGG